MKKIKVMILNGAPQSGKDTFIEMLEKVTNSAVWVYSSIDYVKEVALLMGWNGVKNVKGRKLLSDIKDALTAYDDIPFKKIIEHLHRAKVAINFNLDPFEYFCTCIREPSEILKLELWCEYEGIPCHSLWIRNYEAESTAMGLNNHADLEYMNHTYSYQVNNQTTKLAFQYHIKDLVNLIDEKEKASELLQ